MNTTFWKKLAALWRAEFLSPKDLLKRALVISIVFFIVHLAGLREFTSVLNGTKGSAAMSWETAAFLGLLYVAFDLAFVIVVPVLILAAAILAIGQRIGRKRNSAQ